jgi:hypothetical protein
MRALLLALVVGLLAVIPANADLHQEQFAYGLPLPVTGEQAFYELELPLAVYQRSLRDDLGDLRVFNAAGQIVPHALRRPTNQTLSQAVVSTDLPFFPLADQTSQPDEDLAIHVDRSATGTVVDVRSGGLQSSTPAVEERSYLLDAGALKEKIEMLELLWPPETPAFLADVVIETSIDLLKWRHLQTAAVARLSYQDYRLDQNKIKFSSANSRYLRLSWSSGQPSVQLAGVRVLEVQQYSIKRPAQRHLVLTAVPAAERRYSIDLQGALPVSAVNISLPDKNGLAAVRLYSSPTFKGKLRERWRGLVYNLKTKDSSLSNPGINLPSWRQRYWQLKLDASEAALGAPPQIEFTWQPDRLVFLAQGEGPYLLAYGNPNAETTSFPLADLLKYSGSRVHPQPVQPGAVIALGGADRHSASSFPWKEYSLWGILGLGVLLIGGMSFSLFRKLRDSE